MCNSFLNFSKAEILSKAQELAKKFFNLELPVKEEELKKAFRAACKKYHPDQGGDEAAFKDMKAAYDFLTTPEAVMAGIFLGSEENKSQQFQETAEGIPLFSLGLGLGPTINGTDCPVCHHDGYLKCFGIAWKICTECDEHGDVPQVFQCRHCGGTGLYTQKHGAVVKCYTCKGTGKFKHPKLKTFCRQCFGTKRIKFTDKERFYYVRCENCNGTGEIEIFNPVIPKGRLAQMFK